MKRFSIPVPITFLRQRRGNFSATVAIERRQRKDMRYHRRLIFVHEDLIDLMSAGICAPLLFQTVALVSLPDPYSSLQNNLCQAGFGPHGGFDALALCRPAADVVHQMVALGSVD